MKIRFKKVVAAITLICTLFSTSVVATTSEPVQLPVVNMVDVPVTGDDEGTNQPTIIRISNFLEGKTCTTKTPLGLFDTKINWLATVPSLESDAVELLKAVNKDIRDNNLEYNAIQPLFQFSEDISQFSCKDLALLNAILYQGDNYHDFYKLYKKHDILDEKHEGIFSCNYGLEDTNSKFENGILQSSRDKLLEINRNFGVNYEFDFYEPVWKFRDSLTAMEAYDDFEQKIKTRATETSPDGEDASLLRTAIDSVDINYSNGNEEFTEAGFERVLNEMGPNPSFIDAWNSHALLEVFKRVNKHLVGDQKSRMEDAIIEFAKRKLLVGDSSGTKYSVATVRQIYDRMLSTGLFTSSKLDDLKTFLDEQAVVEYDSPEEAIHNYVTHMDAASIYISGAEFKDALNSNYEGLEWLQLAYGYLDLFAECSPELVVEMWKILQSEDPESIDEIINRILKDKLLPDEIQICVPASGYMQEMEGLITQLYYDTNGASPSFEEFTPFTWYRYRLHSYTGNDIGEMYDRMLRLVYTYPIERYMTEDTFTMGIAYDGFLNWAKKFEGGSHEDTRVNFINNMHKRFLLDDTINSPNVLTFLMIHLDVSPREYIKGMMEKSEYDMLLGDLEYDFATATLSAEMFDDYIAFLKTGARSGIKGYDSQITSLGFYLENYLNTEYNNFGWKGKIVEANTAWWQSRIPRAKEFVQARVNDFENIECQEGFFDKYDKYDVSALKSQDQLFNLAMGEKSIVYPVEWALYKIVSYQGDNIDELIKLYFDYFWAKEQWSLGKYTFAYRNTNSYSESRIPGLSIDDFNEITTIDGSIMKKVEFVADMTKSIADIQLINEISNKYFTDLLDTADHTHKSSILDCTIDKECDNCDFILEYASNHFSEEAPGQCSGVAVTCTKCKKEYTQSHTYSGETCEELKTCRNCPYERPESEYHSWKYIVEDAHPHEKSKNCAPCETTIVLEAETLKSDCDDCHAHGWGYGYEAVHPHKKFEHCAGCNTTNVLEITTTVQCCDECETHTWGYGYEAVHPHRNFKNCSECNKTVVLDGTTPTVGCDECHFHVWGAGYEAVHPHRDFEHCPGCNITKVLDTTTTVQCCDECKTHTWGYGYEAVHPHRNFKNCSECNKTVIVEGTTEKSGCNTCFPPHVHKWSYGHEASHPHNDYKYCAECKMTSYTGGSTDVSSCTKCNPPHTHSWGYGYESSHPHNRYKHCSGCNTTSYVSGSTTMSSCSTCNPPHSHSWGYGYESSHPHKRYKHCSGCNTTSYTGGTRSVSGCSTCYPHSHSWGYGYEGAHPHKTYRYCRGCGKSEYTGGTRTMSSCSSCQ